MCNARCKAFRLFIWMDKLKLTCKTVCKTSNSNDSVLACSVKRWSILRSIFYEFFLSLGIVQHKNCLCRQFYRCFDWNKNMQKEIFPFINSRTIIQINANISFLICDFAFAKKPEIKIKKKSSQLITSVEGSWWIYWKITKQVIRK